MGDLKQIVVSTGFTAITHPFVYAKTLIQLGYEPLHPVRSRNLWGHPVYCYPNIFRYISHMKDEEGFFGLWKGFTPRLATSILGTVITESIKSTNFFKIETNNLSVNNDENESTFIDDSFNTLIKNTGKELVARCVGVVVTYPLQVVTIRCIAQVVGNETKYNNIFDGISEIYEAEGFYGFFDGLVPRLIGDVAVLLACNVLSHFAMKYLIPQVEPNTMKPVAPIVLTQPVIAITVVNYVNDTFRNEINHALSDNSCHTILRHFINEIGDLIVSNWTYPFLLVSTVMAVNNSGLAISNPPYGQKHDSWTTCWIYLREINRLKRGAGIIFRQYPNLV